MDNKNQNNAPAPDYGFILNQTPVGGEPKKKDKKVVLIIVLLTILAIIIIVSVVLSARSRVTTSNAPAASVAPVTAEQVSRQFFTDVQNNMPDEAYKLLSSSYQSRQNLDTFKSTFVAVMHQNLNLQSCQYEAVDTQSNTQKTTCPMQNGKASLVFTVSFEAVGQKAVIKDLAWQATQPLTITDIKQNNDVQ